MIRDKGSWMNRPVRLAGAVPGSDPMTFVSYRRSRNDVIFQKDFDFRRAGKVIRCDPAESDDTVMIPTVPRRRNLRGGCRRGHINFDDRGIIGLKTGAVFDLKKDLMNAFGNGISGSVRESGVVLRYAVLQ